METMMCAKCQRETIRLRTGQCMACAGDEFIRLCTHREAEGACDICAADAETARKAADYDRLAAENERLTRERDEARDTARHMLKRAETAEGSTVSWMETAATVSARAEALATALREATEIVVDCRRDVALTYSDGIIGDAIARAEAALAATPPADQAQHPAYRDGYRAGVEAAARILEAEARASQEASATYSADGDALNAELSGVDSEIKLALAGDVRALLTKGDSDGQ